MKKDYYSPTMASVSVNASLPLSGSGPVKVKSITNPDKKEAFFHSFFGVDLLRGTGGKWDFVGKDYNNQGRALYTFKVSNLHDPFFKEAQANVFEDKGANFTFYSKIPEWNHPFDVVFKIEKNLIYGEGYTEDVSIKRNRDKINKKEWLEWEIDDMNIKMWWDIDDDRRYELNLWTSFDLFDYVKHLLPAQYQAVRDVNVKPKAAEQEILSREEFLSDFFGVNVLREPNEEWTFEGIHPINKYYKFSSDRLQDTFFNSCNVIAFKDGGANFLWQPVPYTMNNALQIAFLIERNLFCQTDMTYEDCVSKHREHLQSYNSIDFKDDEYNISISHDTSEDTMTLTLWTNLNKNEIIGKADEKAPEKYLPRKKGEEELIPRDQFLADFFGVDLYGAPDESWTFEGYKGDTRPHYVFSKNINDPIFHHCELSAFTKGGSTFSWVGLKSEALEAFSVASIIERNLREDETLTPAVCLSKYIEVVLGNTDTIDIHIDDMNFQIINDNNMGLIRLIASTNINKDEVVKSFVR
ncbi:MAG: hypothetical protein IJ209_06660 [Bacteroidaceae bacterium]|nr:hypothetical protein [Bacteroidaceae bacterium]